MNLINRLSFACLLAISLSLTACTQPPQVISGALINASQSTISYPTAARVAKHEGDVHLLLDVDAQGRITQTSIAQSSGDRDLDRAALKAAKRWRFTPAKRGNQAIPHQYLQIISFRL